jgi:hypothetical protein
MHFQAHKIMTIRYLNILLILELVKVAGRSLAQVFGSLENLHGVFESWYRHRRTSAIFRVLCFLV